MWVIKCKKLLHTTDNKMNFPFKIFLVKKHKSTDKSGLSHFSKNHEGKRYPLYGYARVRNDAWHDWEILVFREILDTYQKNDAVVIILLTRSLVIFFPVAFAHQSHRAKPWGHWLRCFPINSWLVQPFIKVKPDTEFSKIPVVFYKLNYYILICVRS